MMNLFALSAEASTETAMSWGERASTAGTVTLMGMVTIFIVLALLWGAIELMHLLLHKGSKKAENASSVSAKSETAVPVAQESAEIVSTDDDVTIAVITAAVSAHLAAEGTVGTFRVVSFKRAGRTSGKNI